MTAPVVLFVYARPEHTRKTVEALQKNDLAGESDLIVFSDAPSSPDKDEDGLLCVGVWDFGGYVSI